MPEDIIVIDPVKKAKKKKAMVMAGTITFLIFVFWIIYFLGHTEKTFRENSKDVALFEKLKENAKKPWEEMKSFFAGLKDKFASIVPADISKEATSTEENLPAKNL